MKKADIAVGRFYTDGKGGLREVLAEGPQYKLYQGVADEDCLRYKSYVSAGGLEAGSENNSTRVSFASWAKVEIPAERVEQWLVDRQAVSVAKKLTAPQRAFLSAFDHDLNLTSHISCSREELRAAKACRDKGLVAEMPDTLQKGIDDFELTFTMLGIAVLKRVHETSEAS
ncbi:hypothetical protein H8F21_13820 [Pseudomonas sp. P66]|uniref:Uncharacterized protein n=1 Tax=Pseudomonas arcuscaelestis TaxID=2710591 RepID=A0ABS2BYE8_9PSED|nr:hypothetical protein [Pseudomonas arcuscaelestis]MBM5458643.1 hypothetical protein [Pseudomonas arcuscaelestis]